MSDTKKDNSRQDAKRANGCGILNPVDLEEKPLSVEQMKLLEMKKYMIDEKSQGIFDMLPLDRSQKVEMLQLIADGKF